MLGARAFAAVASLSRCVGTRATVVARDAALFRATPKTDVIIGDPAGNRIKAGGGGDPMCAAGGADVLRAGRGNDRLDRQRGVDSKQDTVDAVISDDSDEATH